LELLESKTKSVLFAEKLNLIFEVDVKNDRLLQNRKSKLERASLNTTNSESACRNFHARKKRVDGSNHFVNILLRETEKSQQQQRGFRNETTREEQPWLRKKQKKQLRKLLKKRQKKLLKRKRSSFFCKAISFRKGSVVIPALFLFEF
jgi:hypothetical protein